MLSQQPVSWQVHTKRTYRGTSTKSSCEISSHSGGRGKSSCEVSSDLARPGKSSCEVSSHLGKMYLVIEHNHQSFEQLGTSSRDIGSRKSEASSSCRGKHNHFEPVEKMCVVNRAQSLPPTVSPHRHHPLLFSVLRNSIHSRDLGNPANELSPTISPHREDHPPPFRGWRGTKAGLGIRNSLD